MQQSSIDKAVSRLVKVIEQVGLQVVTHTVTQRQASFLCREKNPAVWVSVMRFYLENEPGSWKSHIGKKYMIHKTEQGKKIVYGWYLSFQCDDLVSAVQRIGGLLLKGQLNDRGELRKTQGTGLVDFEVAEPPKPSEKNKNQVAQARKAKKVYADDEAPYPGPIDHGAPLDPAGLHTKGAYLFGRAPTSPKK